VLISSPHFEVRGRLTILFARKGLKATSNHPQLKYNNSPSLTHSSEGGLFQIITKHNPILFKGYPIRWQDFIYLLILGAGAVFLPLGYGYWRAFYGYSQYGPSAANAWSYPWFITSACSTLLLLLLSLTRINIAHKFIVVQENGLHIHLSPLKDQNFSWEHISGVTFEISRIHFLRFPLRSKKIVRIYRKLGKPIQFGDEIQGLTSLVNEIKHRLYPRIWPSLENDIRKGSWVYFGEIGLHREGLKFQKIYYPWSKVKRVSIESGNAVVELTDHHRLTHAISRIPNIELLFQLIQRGPTHEVMRNRDSKTTKN
jgi:hypothetical protein